MVAQRIVNTTPVTKKSSAVQQAVTVLQEYRSTRVKTQRWVCEVCGMIHTATTPSACESCGSSHALVQQEEGHLEMNSHW